MEFASIQISHSVLEFGCEIIIISVENSFCYYFLGNASLPISYSFFFFFVLFCGSLCLLDIFQILWFEKVVYYCFRKMVVIQIPVKERF